MMAVSEEAQKAPLNDDELTKVFNEIDDDGNGYITPREAKKAFKKLAEKFNISRVSFLKNRTLKRLISLVSEPSRRMDQSYRL